jgi:predicted Zn-dependent protease
VQADRDTLLLTGLYGIQNQDTQMSKFAFQKLYEKEGLGEYLIELVRILNSEGQREQALELLEGYNQKHPNDLNIRKLIVTELFELKDLTKASQMAATIANETKNPQDEEMAGDLYLASNNQNAAIKYYKLAYEKTKNEKTLDKIATITYSHLGQKGDAIALYETHTKMYGCSKYLCERLAIAYQEQANYAGVIDVNKRLYLKTKDKKYFQRVVELSAAIGDLNGLVAFLKESKADEKLLLEAYKYQKDYKHAIPLAKKLWLSSKDTKYLAEYAMLRIDEYPDGKAPMSVVSEATTDLKTAIKANANDIYENFLGYLLIDYDINVAEGVSFVQKALEKDPTSPFYADSLAWGYYKLKKCDEALVWMKKASEKLSDDPVIKAHLDAIKKCSKK